MRLYPNEFMLRAQTAGMAKPARCGCGRVYDIGAAPILNRYQDCSTWQCPGCKREINDLHEQGWSPVKMYTLLPVVSREEVW